MAAKKKRKPALGSGKRFAQLKAKLAGRKGVADPAALADHIGRQKLGAGRMAALATKGRQRAARKK